MTQNERIMRHLETYGSITPAEAMQEYSCMRLASRISDLKKRGADISRELVFCKNRFGEPTHYAKYTLNE